MRNSRLVFLVALVSGLITLSGCHHVQAPSPKIRWVSESDSKKVLEVMIRYPSMLGRAHMAVLGGSPLKGTYVMKDGETTAEGVVTQLEDSYRLTPKDGKEQRYDVDRTTGSLKDESGQVWKADNPPTTATLKEW